jgi:N-acetylmuramoyl-L-alanine amidase
MKFNHSVRSTRLASNIVSFPYGEYFKTDEGNIRNVITQPGQFTCMEETVGGQYNPQDVYNMNPDQIHYVNRTS